MNLIPVITEYLTSHRRLVVPQLGAFIRKNESGEVVFSELLKRDDGVLRALLTKQGLGEIEAAGLIDRFIFELRHSVEHGSVFQAEGLGIFAQGPNGTIRFRYLPIADEPHTAESAPDGVMHDIDPRVAPEVENQEQDKNPDSSESDNVMGQSQTADPDSNSKSEETPELQQSADEKRTQIRGLMRFSDEHPREHRSSSQPRREDPSVRGLRYGSPQKSTDAYTYVNSAPSRRPDTFIVLAVLAVVIALGAILYGYWNDRRKAKIEQGYNELFAPATPSVEPQTEVQPEF